MPLNTSRLTRLLRRLREGRSATFAEAAERVVTLAPACEQTIPPAIHLPGQPDRILGFSPWRTESYERASLAGGAIRRDASVAYVLREADVVGPYLYCGSLKARIGWGPEPIRTGSARETIDEDARLVTSFSGSRWFGCLLLDDFTFEIAAEGPDLRLRAAAQSFPQAAGYREVLGLDLPRLAANSRVRRLWVYEEPAANESRAARYRDLRGRLREHLGPGDGIRGRGVFLRRGAGGERRELGNGDQIEEALARIGFDVLDPSSLTPREIARRTLDADIVVAVEGSHLSHAIFSMADTGTFLVLEPPDRFALPYKDFADCLGMRYAFVVGTPGSGGFAVDIDELMRTVELIRG